MSSTQISQNLAVDTTARQTTATLFEVVTCPELEIGESKRLGLNINEIGIVYNPNANIDAQYAVVGPAFDRPTVEMIGVSVLYKFLQSHTAITTATSNRDFGKFALSYTIDVKVTKDTNILAKLKLPANIEEAKELLVGLGTDPATAQANLINNIEKKIDGAVYSILQSDKQFEVFNNLMTEHDVISQEQPSPDRLGNQDLELLKRAVTRRLLDCAAEFSTQASRKQSQPASNTQNPPAGSTASNASDADINDQSSRLGYATMFGGFFTVDVYLKNIRYSDQVQQWIDQSASTTQASVAEGNIDLGYFNAKYNLRVTQPDQPAPAKYLVDAALDSKRQLRELMLQSAAIENYDALVDMLQKMGAGITDENSVLANIFNTTLDAVSTKINAQFTVALSQNAGSATTPFFEVKSVSTGQLELKAALKAKLDETRQRLPASGSGRYPSSIGAYMELECEARFNTDLRNLTGLKSERTPLDLFEDARKDMISQVQSNALYEDFNRRIREAVKEQPGSYNFRKIAEYRAEITNIEMSSKSRAAEIVQELRAISSREGIFEVKIIPRSMRFVDEAWDKVKEQAERFENAFNETYQAIQRLLSELSNKIKDIQDRRNDYQIRRMETNAIVLEKISGFPLPDALLHQLFSAPDNFGADTTRLEINPLLIQIHDLGIDNYSDLKDRLNAYEKQLEALEKNTVQSSSLPAVQIAPANQQAITMVPENQSNELADCLEKIEVTYRRSLLKHDEYEAMRQKCLEAFDKSLLKDTEM